MVEVEFKREMGKGQHTHSGFNSDTLLIGIIALWHIDFNQPAVII